MGRLGLAASRATTPWTVAGAPSVTTQTITGASFDSGDAIACTATPTDGTTPGTPLTSASVTIGNTAPSITGVSISPTTAYTNTLLTATPAGWSDADGDPPSYMYEWFSGTTAVGTDAPTLPGTAFDKSEVITVQVTPQDLTSSGTPVTSAGVTILNTVPGAPGVTLTPPNPTLDNNLVCSVTTPSPDADNDTVTYTYAWLVGGVASGDTGAVLPNSATTAGETWTCEATPFDGVGAGPPGNASVAVTATCLSTTSTAQGMDFVPLCGGTFNMGCTAAQQADGNCGSVETPAHSVVLTNDLWMTETEVTQAQWQAMMGSSPAYFGSCGSACPVERVNWYEALAFANAASTAEGLAVCYVLGGCSGTIGAGCAPALLGCYSGTYSCSSLSINSVSGSVYDCEGYRLPTEAEWEYAARAGTDLLYAGSDTIDDVAWYYNNSGSTTHLVATKLPNGWGLYDLSGNVFEWTWDWLGASYYSTSPGVDPEGPASASGRVGRGGYWSGNAPD